MTSSASSTTSVTSDRDARVLALRCGLLLGVTGFWWLRGFFPVNSFSANYTEDKRSEKGYSRLLGWMYRIKKYQYLFYKHFLLHGLNVSFALRRHLPHFPLGLAVFTAAATTTTTTTAAPSSLALDLSLSHSLTTTTTTTATTITTILTTLTPRDLEWRLYWVCLNTAYTFEFFLQTLVKRRHLTQRTMLLLNQMSMAASSAAALQVLGRGVCLPVAALSWCLNIARRQREVANTTLVVAVAIVANAALAYWCLIVGLYEL